MQRIGKSTVLLPLVQSILAWGLLVQGRFLERTARVDTVFLPTSTAFCLGINAPAAILRAILPYALSFVNIHIPPVAFRLAVDEVLFLLLVALLWLGVAKWLSWNAEARQRPKTRLRFGLFACLLAATIAIILGCYGTLYLFSSTSMNNSLAVKIEGAFFLAWAVALFYAITIYFRRTRRTT